MHYNLLCYLFFVIIVFFIDFMLWKSCKNKLNWIELNIGIETIKQTIMAASFKDKKVMTPNLNENIISSLI